MSDENLVFSREILGNELFLNTKKERIVDVGTGDGDVALRIISKDKRPKKYVLADPSEEYLSVAKMITKECDSGKVECVKMNLRDVAKNYGGSLLLSVHMIYLLSLEEIKLLLGLTRAGNDLIVIVDDPNSVFNRLWMSLAPSYYEKCKFFFELLSSEYYGAYDVAVVTTKVLSPFKARIDDYTKRAMLSTMCYADWDDLSPRKKQIAQELIEKSITNDVVSCKSKMISFSCDKK